MVEYYESSEWNDPINTKILLWNNKKRNIQYLDYIMRNSERYHLLLQGKVLGKRGPD